MIPIDLTLSLILAYLSPPGHASIPNNTSQLLPTIPHFPTHLRPSLPTSRRLQTVLTTTNPAHASQCTSYTFHTLFSQLHPFYTPQPALPCSAPPRPNLAVTETILTQTFSHDAEFWRKGYIDVVIFSIKLSGDNDSDNVRKTRSLSSNAVFHEFDYLCFFPYDLNFHNTGIMQEIPPIMKASWIDCFK